MTVHPQVPFTTANGLEVLVDEEMVDILTEFKRLGSESLFSCQGGTEKGHPKKAYVSLDGASFDPVLERLLANHTTAALHGLDVEFYYRPELGQDTRIVLRWPKKEHNKFLQFFREIDSV